MNQRYLFPDFAPATQPAASGDNGRMNVAHCIKAFLCDMPTGAAEADAEKRRVLKLFLQDFGDRELAACKPIHLKNWIEGHPAWQSGHTLTRIRNTVQSCFNWCIDPLGIIDRNPFAGRIHFKKGPEGLPMEDSLFRLYLRNSAPEFRRVLLFIKYTGCRPCEMANADWGDFDQDRKAIVLHVHKTSRTQKVSRPRTVILHPVLVRLLLWLRRHGRETGIIFVNAWGNRWSNSTICQRLTVIRKRCGIPKARTAYGLRHRACCQAVKKGVNLATIAELMGHRDIKTTMRYVHLAGETEHLQEAVKKIHG